MRYSRDATINKTVEELLKSGWVIKSRSRHLRIVEPNLKLTITVPGTPSDRRAVQNWLHQARNTIAQRMLAYGSHS